MLVLLVLVLLVIVLVLVGWLVIVGDPKATTRSSDAVMFVLFVVRLILSLFMSVRHPLQSNF